MIGMNREKLTADRIKSKVSEEFAKSGFSEVKTLRNFDVVAHSDGQTSYNWTIRYSDDVSSPMASEAYEIVSRLQSDYELIP